MTSNRNFWVKVSALIHPEGVSLDWGQDSVQAAQIILNQTYVHIFMDLELALWTAVQSGCNSKEFLLNCSKKVWGIKLSRCRGLLKSKAQLLEEGLKPKPLCTELYTWQCCKASVFLIENTKLIDIQRIARLRWVICQVMDNKTISIIYWETRNVNSNDQGRLLNTIVVKCSSHSFQNCKINNKLISSTWRFSGLFLRDQ